MTVSQLEEILNRDRNNLARGVKYDFFTNLSLNVRQVIKENRRNIPIFDPTVRVNPQPETAFLLAEPEISSFDSNSIGTNIPIWHNSVIKDSSFYASPLQISSSQIGTGQVGSNYVSTTQVGTNQFSFGQIGISQISPTHTRFSQVSISEDTTDSSTLTNSTGTQISPSEINILHVNFPQIGITQINPAQINIIHFGTSQDSSSKVTLPNTISSQQFFNTNTTHNLTSDYLSQLQSTLASDWYLPTDLNITFQIADLHTGQLAEATITGYNTFGRPNSGTLNLDTDGNGLGWFIDTTPDDNSEFTTQLADTAYKATADSAAYGKYDLLTTILHELGHLNGIIRGNTAFDIHVQNINGIPTFINGSTTATLTPDGSHLDSTLYPYDLMNTSLKPGVRKLPSALDLAILNTLWSNKPTTSQQLSTTANLTAGALIGITNGDFTTPTTWNTAGATNIINGTATLTEQSQKLSELTQAFIIPTGAKTLQFTIKDNHLIPGDITKTANDAFEVALLDTNTYNPLAGTSIGLNHTDSLLNIQANGTIHKSDKVTITALTNNSSIVTINLTQITPTQATLYFNLLGFGARTSTVTIDDVKLFTDTQPIPVTKNDTLVTNQNTPLTFTTTQLTTNDTNVTQIQIINQPTHGTLTQTPDGKLTYTPVPTYVGNDQSPPFNARLKFCR
jgi:Bacterial cadherin-like domain